MRLNLKRGNEDAAVVVRFCAASVLTALFIALAVTVKFVDTSAIGPNGTVVGLSAVNGAVRDVVGYSETWYALSEALGCFPIGVLLGLVIIGAAELIKTKKISAELWILAAFYVLLAAIYVAFELIGLNYRPVLLGGDFNVILTAEDVYDEKAFLNNALCREEVRQKLTAIRYLGFYDAFRLLHPQEKGYTFWDYAGQAFPADNGMRIDYMMLSPQAADRLLFCEVDKDPRRGVKPSDHTPLIVELKS